MDSDVTSSTTSRYAKVTPYLALCWLTSVAVCALTSPQVVITVARGAVRRVEMKRMEERRK